MMRRTSFKITRPPSLLHKLRTQPHDNGDTVVGQVQLRVTSRKKRQSGLRAVDRRENWAKRHSITRRDRSEGMNSGLSLASACNFVLQPLQATQLLTARALTSQSCPPPGNVSSFAKPQALHRDSDTRLSRREQRNTDRFPLDHSKRRLGLFSTSLKARSDVHASTDR